VTNEPFTSTCVWCGAPVRHRADTSLSPPHEWWQADHRITTQSTCQSLGGPEYWDKVLGGHQVIKDEWWLPERDALVPGCGCDCHISNVVSHVAPCCSPPTPTSEETER